LEKANQDVSKHPIYLSLSKDSKSRQAATKVYFNLNLILISSMTESKQLPKTNLWAIHVFIQREELLSESEFNLASLE